MGYYVLLSIFFVSGAVGLGYHVLWSKVILSFIGVGAYSYAVVLATFMAGLAMGSLWLGRWADRAASPLKLYAYLEFGISIYALLYLPLTHSAMNLYAKWAVTHPDPGNSTLGMSIKAMLSAGLLLFPTFLMGGTYPALLRHATKTQEGIGRKSSQVYAINAFGAGMGSILMAYLVLPSLGIRASLTVLAGCNGLIALFALCLAGVGDAGTWGAGGADPAAAGKVASDPHHSDAPVGAPSGAQSIPLTVPLILIFVAGFTSFVYEIVWIRFFGIVLGSSTYSFSVVITAFTTGIALGCAILGAIESRVRAPMRFFAWTQIAAGVLVLLPLPFYPYLFGIFSWFGGLLSTDLSSFYIYEADKLLCCYLVMLPPTIFIGMAVPLGIKSVTSDLDRLGREAGKAYAWNTAGNVLGAILAGWILLSWLGMERLIRFTALVNILLGLMAFLIFVPRETDVRHQRNGPIMAILILLAFVQLFIRPWNPAWFAITPFRRADAGFSIEEMRRRVKETHVFLFKDDPAGHIMVAGSTATADTKLTLYVNGKPDASSHGNMPTQLLLGHIPALLHPHPRDVCVIGLGSGVTGGALLDHDIGRLDVIELAGAMPEASRFFSRWNNNLLSDTRVSLITDDARSHLTYSSRMYDVVVSQPSNPWVAGGGALFSREFYAAAKQVLRPGGIYCQWMQSYELGDDIFLSVVRSFRTAFPYVYAFQVNVGDMILLGCLKPLDLDWTNIQKRLDRPKIARSLKQIHIHSLADILYFQRFSPGTVDYLAAVAQRENTDDNLLLEHAGPRHLFQKINPQIPLLLDERLSSAPSLFWSARPQQPTMLRILTYERPPFERIAQAHWIASHHLTSDTSWTATIPAANESFLAGAPLSAEAISKHILEYARKGQDDMATALLDAYSPTILLESALSKESAHFWGSRLQIWMNVKTAGPFGARAKMLWIKYLMACGKSRSAADELSAWAGSSTPPPPADAVLLAGQIDPGILRSQILDIYLRRGKPHPPFLERLADLGALPRGGTGE